MAKALSIGTLLHAVYPDDVPEETVEGAKKRVTVNTFERSADARQKCIDHYGYKCTVFIFITNFKNW